MTTLCIKNLVCLLFLAGDCSLLTVQNKEADSFRTYESEEWVAGKLSLKEYNEMLCTQARSGLKNVFLRFREDIFKFTDDSVKFVAASSTALQENNASTINWVGAYEVSVQMKKSEIKYSGSTIQAKIEGNIKIRLIDVMHRTPYHLKSKKLNPRMQFRAPDDGLLGVLDVHKAAVFDVYKAAVQKHDRIPGLIENLHLVAISEFGTHLHAKYRDENGPQNNCYAVFSIVFSEDLKVTESTPKKEYEEFVAAGISQFKDDLCTYARYYIPPFRTDIYYRSSDSIKFTSAKPPIVKEDNPTINFVCNYSVSINTIQIESPWNDYTVKEKVEGNFTIHLDKVTPRKSYQYNRGMKFSTPDAHRDVLELHKVTVHQKGLFPGSIDCLELVATAVLGTQLHAKYMDKYGFQYICYAEFSIVLGKNLRATVTP